MCADIGKAPQRLSMSLTPADPTLPRYVTDCRRVDRLLAKNPTLPRIGTDRVLTERVRTTDVAMHPEGMHLILSLRQLQNKTFTLNVLHARSI